MTKKFILSALCISFATGVAAQAPSNIEWLYAHPQEKWPSPTPWIEDRFTNFLEYMPHNGVVIEVGVQRGGFAIHMLHATQPQHLYLVDCWEQQDPQVYDDPEANVSNNEQEEYYRETCRRFAPYKNQVTILRQYSKAAAEQFEDGFFDWVYIDSNHSYEAAKEDIALWWPKVKSGGFLSGHDYKIRPSFGVVQAVNEFLRDQGLCLKYLSTEDHGYNSWAIEKP